MLALKFCGEEKGKVLSPIPFSICLDSLLLSLKHTDVGCSWSGKFSCVLTSGDDIVLLAPSLAALRILHGECRPFMSRGLQFQSKTQFMEFYHYFYI